MKTTVRHGSDYIEMLEREVSFKDLLIKRLLGLTQSINSNVSAPELFRTYTDILTFDLQIQQFVLFIRNNDEWQYAASSGLSLEFAKLGENEDFEDYKNMMYLNDLDHPFLKEFDLVIPIYHKESPISIVFIGNMELNKNVYDKLEFVKAVTNVISVAIENKRLFKQQISQERMKKEVELARQVQEMMIPKDLPSNEKYELDGIYMPHSIVGGDYFDYIELADNEFAICIADISGKGVPAALLMSNFQANVQVLIRKRLDGKKFIELLNKTVMRITKGEKFITFFIAKYYVKERRLTYINAGHNPPLLFSGGEVTYLNKGCTILGSFDNIPNIELGEIFLHEDALLVAYTDGLTDLKNANEEYFEEDKLVDFLEENQYLSPKTLNKKLVQKINQFKGDQEFPDDISVLTCKFFIPTT